MKFVKRGGSSERSTSERSIADAEQIGAPTSLSYLLEVFKQILSFKLGDIVFRAGLSMVLCMVQRNNNSHLALLGRPAAH